jgi:hypothetical protein
MLALFVERRFLLKLIIKRKNGKTSYRLRIWKLAITVEFPLPGRKP